VDYKCANCDGNHPSSSSSCPTWLAKLKEKSESTRRKSVQIVTAGTPNSQQHTLIINISQPVKIDIEHINARMDQQEAAINANKQAIDNLPKLSDSNRIYL
jgi:Holliday junction resolvase RusA-like endonuclease